MSATIGGRIRFARMRSAISQRELAQAAGISHSYLSRIEDGARVPAIEAIRRLAAALDVSPYYLETGDTDGVYIYLARHELSTIRDALLFTAKGSWPVDFAPSDDLIARLEAALSDKPNRK